MCGIVGAVAGREHRARPHGRSAAARVSRLRFRRYRGTQRLKHLTRLRTVGKVRMLDEALEQTPTTGKIGIAHTRWATHGVPSERNAHPHISHDGLAIVHNGIIENHEELRADLERRGYTFVFRDRHRGDRAPRALSPGHAAGSVQGGARHGGRARGRLRAGGRQRARSGAADPRARGLPGGHRARQR